MTWGELKAKFVEKGLKDEDEIIWIDWHSADSGLSVERTSRGVKITSEQYRE